MHPSQASRGRDRTFVVKGPPVFFRRPRDAAASGNQSTQRCFTCVPCFSPPSRLR